MRCLQLYFMHFILDLDSFEKAIKAFGKDSLLCLLFHCVHYDSASHSSCVWCLLLFQIWIVLMLTLEYNKCCLMSLPQKSWKILWGNNTSTVSYHHTPWIFCRIFNKPILTRYNSIISKISKILNLTDIIIKRRYILKILGNYISNAFT